MRYQMYKDIQGQWRWRLFAANNQQDIGVTSCFLAIGSAVRLALSETGVRWRDGASFEDEISQGS